MPSPALDIINCFHLCPSDGCKIALVFTISGIQHLFRFSFFFLLESSIWGCAGEYPIPLAPSRKQGDGLGG